ncbi:PAS domain S-box protein [Sphingomonas sinipercae]|uniref:histidine kinase n=1 Tax=Sphingomonas sinipercae TaxID=2714944 RepID=A0A6G7ZQ92_9SPHN|nr:PAS domain-containing sensor histidine kinase [Sphingomonas sinipercae]QIL03095.1 PAS domain S-box protein [Sphingomonas sinipercae]
MAWDSDQLSDLSSISTEQRLQLLVNAVTDYAIYLLDVDGHVASWNPGAERFKGYRAEEIIGQHFSRFYTEEDRGWGEPRIALETALNEGKYEREARRVRKDGTLFWAHVVIDPIFDSTGKHIGFAKITRDITERKEAQQRLEETQAALAQSQKLQALGELTGGIAHDFNNLMTVISGSSDFLLRKPDLPVQKRKQYLQAIAETAERASTLTNHLLAFGRRQALKPQVMDLNARLDAVAEMLSRTIGSKFKLVLELNAVPAVIEVDPTQLETAILNAALNARDALGEGGTVTIGTANVEENGARFVRLSISDEGEGMPPEVVSRAFEPFFTTKDVGKGTGLGLSQIHGFAAQAGGRAEIASQPQTGTTVSLLIPASEKPLDAPNEQAPLASLPKGVRVLLVEDNERVREFAQGLLEDLGCKVSAAASATEALRLLDTDGADVVLSDVVMPGMTGLALARKLRETHPDLPVLLATGYSDEIRKTGSEFAVLAKPFAVADLSEALATTLAGNRNRAA